MRSSNAQWRKRLELGAATLVLALTGTAATHAATVRVGTDRPYATVRDGIAAALDGDTVLVDAGTYFEYGIVIDHPISLIGVGRPVIDARSEGEIIKITADHARVSGLELRNVGTSFMQDRAAIRLSEVTGCVVEDNVLVNAFFGIYAENTAGSKIRSNTLRGRAQREATSGNGIHLWHCRGITITENIVTGHRDGIYFEFVEESTVTSNTSAHNLRYGLHFMFSNRDVYDNNRFSHNGAGVAVMYSSDVNMRHNVFEHNWGVASYGLLLKEIRDSAIENNAFRQNTIALYAEGSNRIKVRRNEFDDNGYAIKVMANCNDNSFSENNFIGNQFDVATNSRHNFNTFESNYWSDYRGYDLDRDGVGDVPHRPVRLYALLVEKQPPGIILMNSLFVRMIDTAERVMPVFTPETLTDPSPRMSMYVSTVGGSP